MNLAENVQRTINSLWVSILWGGLLVAFLAFVFFSNGRMSLILLTSIPSSIIISFLFLYISGYTLNIMSLSAIAIAIGLVVDMSIVVLENINRRRISMGEGKNESAIKGANEVGLAVSSATFTTIVVFLALIFTTGFVGILFKQLAMVVTITLVVSLFCSLTLVPMLASFVETPKDAELRANKFYRVKLLVDVLVEKTAGFFVSAVSYSFKNRKKVITLFVVVFLGSLGLTRFVGTEFFPMQDSSFLDISIKVCGENL